MTKQRQRVLSIGLLIIMTVSFLLAIFFAGRKQGFHEDEYYSYYSTNYSNGWTVPNGEWLESKEYAKEFFVLPNERFQYGLVKEVQSWDVHPPMYYWILHTVCSLSPNVFSKWQGLTVNIVSYLLSIVLVFLCAKVLFKEEKEWYFPLLVCTIFAISPATLSGVMFIRMYSLLDCIVLLSLFLHLKLLEKDKIISLRYLLPLILIVYCGFLTHYYFMIFQFFLTASICIDYFFVRNRKKDAVIYGLSILLAIGLGIVTYPSCLGQMFHGQRGAQATASFFDLRNTFERLLYFIKLTNHFWFGNMLLLICVVLIILAICFRRKKENEYRSNQHIVWILAITCVGYFFAVSKTALMLGDSSVRYILPIMAPCILLLFKLLQIATGKIDKRECLILGLSGLILVGNIFNICHGKVLFLYKEDAQKVEFAKEYQDTPVVYIYHDSSAWQIWDSTNELLEYPRVFFVSDTNDDGINPMIEEKTDQILVYLMNNTNIDEQLKKYDMFSKQKLIRKDQFCNVYLFEK